MWFFDYLHRLDVWTIVQVKRRTDWLQRTVGLRASTLARLAIALGTVNAVVREQWFLTVMGLLDFGLMLYLQGKREPSDVVDIGDGLINISFGRKIRLVFVPLFVPRDLVAGTWWLEAITIAWILHSCNDLPPMKSSVRKLLEQALTALRPAHNVNMEEP